jgi:SAM-dependent methyltransferase
MSFIHSVIKSFYWNFYIRIFPNIVILVRTELEGCESFLELGCGRGSPVKHFSKEFRSAGVDIFKPYIEESRRQGIHNEYFCMDVRKLKFKPKSFDAVLALDLIEHLTKKEGEKLLKDMEKIAKKRVIVFTPNGFLKQEAYEGDEYQTHKSGWTVSEMKDRGYRVVGVNGVKFLRKEKAELVYPPKYLWWFISDITQLFTYHFPEYAFQLFCAKDIG